MLLEFSVKNFYSFKDKVTFSMVANSSKNLEENYVKKDKFNILKTSAIYGANASGKSNLFKILEKVTLMLSNSNNIRYYDDLPIEPFKFDKNCAKNPSEFEIRFTVNDIEYIYGFSASKEEIYEEYLYYYPSGKETKIFYRKKENNYFFTSRESNKLKPLVNKNTKNKFFLATATNWNYEKTKPAYEFLTKNLIVCRDTESLEKYSLKKYYNETELKKFTLEFLKKADINIIDYKIDKINLSIRWENVFERENSPEYYQAFFKHKGNNEMWLDMEEESLGTKMIFYIIPFISEAIRTNQVVVIDELDKSLHPFLVEYIVKFFNNRETNKNASQLIFNTHDTNLLDLNILRRDQIWFTEKNDEDGRSDLYSLSDFSVRKNENVEKGYLLGRYGAIPFITNDINLWGQED